VTTHRLIFIAAATAAALVGCGSDTAPSSESSSAVAAYDATETGPQVLFDAESDTILGQPIVYPDGTAQISSSIITLAPGEETGSHFHETPLYAYILSGSLTVDYGDDGERTYNAGDAVLEAIGTSHNGRASSDEPVRILAVNIGSDSAANTLAD
jgi:quercetin dioxygenase-like cupin family protein